MGGSGDVYSPNLQHSRLPFIYLNLSAILIPSGRFSCSRQMVAKYLIMSSFITSLLEQGPQDWPNVSYLRILDKS